MENGSSFNLSAVKDKLENRGYLDNAIQIISEQLVYFFYTEWKDEEEIS